MQTRTSLAMASSAARRSSRVTRCIPPAPTGSRSLALRTQPRSSEHLGDLDRVRRRALAQVVRHDPEGEPAVVRRSTGPGAPGRRTPRPAGGRRSRAGRRWPPGRPGRRRPSTPANSVARLGGRDRLAGLDVDGLGVADEHRHADGRARDAQVRQVEDLAALRDDLPLLLRVPVVEEHVDVRQGVERDRVRVDRRDLRPALGVGLDLLLELVDGLVAGARDGLVRVDDRPARCRPRRAAPSAAARAASSSSWGWR